MNKALFRFCYRTVHFPIAFVRCQSNMAGQTYKKKTPVTDAVLRQENNASCTTGVNLMGHQRPHKLAHVRGIISCSINAVQEIRQ